MNAPTTHTFDALPTINQAETLFALATAMEAEAARCYEGLATRMTAAARPELARLFSDLATQERDHEAGIQAWARQNGAAGGEAPRFQWDGFEAITEEGLAEAGGEQLITPERALNLAIHNEQRAMAFYVRVASEAEAAPVREYAETMAREELHHIAQLRLARRRAARRRRTAQVQRAPFTDRETLEESVTAHNAEHGRQLRGIAQAARGTMAPDIAAQLDNLAADLTPPANASASVAATPEAIRDALQQAMTADEALYERLMHTAETADDETLVGNAQTQAESVIRRLAALNDAAAVLTDASAAPGP